MSLPRPANITIVSCEDAEHEQFNYIGTWYEKKDKPFILFDETMEDGTVVHSAIRIDPDKVAVLRHERIGGHMILDPNHRQKTRYQAPYGLFEFYVTTHLLETLVEKDHIRIKAEYSLQLLFDENEEPDPDKQDVRRSLDIIIKEQ